MHPGSLEPPEPVSLTEQTGIPRKDNPPSASPGPNQFSVPSLFMPIKEGPPPFSPSLAMSKSISTSSHFLTPGLSYSQDSPSSLSQMSLVTPTTRKILPQKQSSRFVCTVQGCSVVLRTKSEQREHAKSHNKKFACDIGDCRQAFTSRKDLNRHKNKSGAHLNSSTLVFCCACGYRTPRDDHHRTHILESCKIQLEKTPSLAFTCKCGHEEHGVPEHMDHLESCHTTTIKPKQSRQAKRRRS
ncbi:hypothetical protein B0T11DRAFT_48640 [Plectosphaerella cucumerina]|uniref:C2H2-type domain-containing protein n=1 Tax=Plectosphaerella cucumerina TaxID=40658 RepID=A0A8K0X5U4_9PEZI|nr:hypothetical protein B0T11DRAFT_48640 [Plectosphaerella cucumerina]